MLTREQKRKALEIARQDDWDDPWGTAMSHAFAISDTLYHAEADIPGQWGYRHGMFQHDPVADWHPYDQPCPLNHSTDYPDECNCQYPDREYVPFLDAGEFGIELLTYAGNVLDRYCGFVKRAGKDY